MTDAKTKPTAVDPQQFIAQIPDEGRRKDLLQLAELMQKITGKPAVMWGPSIIGFDRYQYRYDSGHSGEWAVTGFANRAKDITVYLMAGAEGQQELFDRLGKHRMGKSCLYIRKLADVDQQVLEQLIRHSVAEIKRLWG